MSPSGLWEALPQVLSLSPEMGSSEADIASQGWGSLGRDGDLLKFTPRPKSGSGEAEFDFLSSRDVT
jgi:hypothetical protein